jgi:4-diphosphocytidyl-2-C-methyl-D-erythritol kinase
LTLVVPARAKLNLDLAVVASTDDGFHDVRTHMQSIALHDLLELTRADRTSITTSGGYELDSTRNSVLEAHTAMREATGLELPTKFHLVKRIPPGSGMGGASSDAAAAMRGIVTIHNLEAARADLDLAKIAARIGADVPFFLTGGAALAEGRGERLTPLQSDPAWFAIAWPQIELSTATVYRAWDEVGGDGPNHLTRAARHVEPKLEEFAARLGDGWQMTGSGSAFFRRTADRESAQRAVANADCWTAVTNAVGAWA